MQIFLDSASVPQIQEALVSGLVDGITTNPSLIAKEKDGILEIGRQICPLIDGPVSLEVTAKKFDDIVRQGTTLSEIAENVVVKIPLTPDGLRACAFFDEKEIATNVTLCFSAAQALLAAKAGATYISPFVGRLEDTGAEGMQLLQDIREIYDSYGFDTQVLAASMRTPEHVLMAARAGADAATLSYGVFKKLFEHPLTTQGLETFERDSEKSGQSF